jgi:hypothetical protein
MGQMPDDLRRDSTGLIFRDRDWEAGLRLLDYQVGECTEEDGCLRCPVRLRLRGRQDQTVDRWVIYRVAVGPERLIARD